MELIDKNVIAAYHQADDSSKKLLRAMFPDLDFEQSERDNRPVTERIKTFDDACREVCGKSAEEWEQENETDCMDSDVIAYLKLRIICQALNEGWKPKFTKNEVRWYPWFYLYTAQKIADKENSNPIISVGEYETEYCGFAFAFSSYAPSGSNTGIGSRLCLQSEALATYCGQQFISLWADFCLIRK